MLGKRGVSPLVATLLLVGFAVALGGVVMSWGQNIVEDGAAGHSACVDISVALQDLSNGRQICHGGIGKAGFIDFIVANNAPFPVNGLSVWIFGQSFDQSNIVKVTEISDINIDSQDPYTAHVLYDFTRFGEISKVQIVPKAKDGSNCFDNSIIWTDIGVC